MAENERVSVHGQWSGQMAFILAATGSAVGLGNIWKFPYITGENGGGAFVAVYLICILAIGIPIMIAEIMLGRRGRQSPINTMATLAKEEGHHTQWKLLGWMGVIAGFLILSYYSVIAGWAMAYVLRSASGIFVGASADGVNAVYEELISDPERLLAWHTMFIVLTMVVVARGVQHGLEKAVRFLMPMLLLILLLLVGYAATTGHFAEGARYLFTFDFSKLSEEAILTAMGHAFFTLSLGMGAIMVYGSYLPRQTSIVKTTAVIAGADTMVALLAGMAIFPIVFAYGLEPASGSGLIFKTLPLAFGAMEGGVVLGTIFFVLVVFAAWSSAISLIEPAVAWLVENRGYNRLHAAVLLGILVWFLGLGTVFSFNIGSDYTLTIPYLFENKNFFEVLDYLTANIMLPLGGLFIAVFAGWLMRPASCRAELQTSEWAFKVWLVLVRFVAPVGVIFVFLNVLGLDLNLTALFDWFRD